MQPTSVPSGRGDLGVMLNRFGLRLLQYASGKTAAWPLMRRRSAAWVDDVTPEWILRDLIGPSKGCNQLRVQPLPDLNSDMTGTPVSCGVHVRALEVETPANLDRCPSNGAFLNSLPSART